MKTVSQYVKPQLYIRNIAVFNQHLATSWH